MDGFKGGFKFDFTYVDSNMEGRINIAEFEEFCRQCEKQWGPERCSRAASRYIGTRQAELRTNAKTSFQKRATMSMFDGFDAEASHRLLMCCSPKEVENNASSLVESVQACLEQGADPNVFLLDKVTILYYIILCHIITLYPITFYYIVLYSIPFYYIIYDFIRSTTASRR